MCLQQLYLFNQKNEDKFTESTVVLNKCNGCIKTEHFSRLHKNINRYRLLLSLNRPNPY